jgi:hypothetical protein
MPWTFLNYVDDNGVNQIKTWIDELPADSTKVGQRLLTILLHLRAEQNLMGTEYIKPLHGDCEGLLEIRFGVRRLEYRPLACYGPRNGEVTILVGALEKENRFVPRNACAIALERCEKAYADRKHVTDHDIT